MYYYTVYFRRTDELVASGTSKECAAQLNMTIKGFYDMERKARLGKHRSYEVLRESYFDVMKEDEESC